MSQLLFRAALLAVVVIFAAATQSKRAPANEQYVSTNGRGFSVNGSEFRFIGTTAYWLTTLHTEEDVDRTFASMRARGIRVVRTWAFNDVEAVPDSGDWIQLISNGTTTLNTGPNGVRKLDIVIRQAEKHGIYLMLTLTNNWNPRPLLDDLTNRINGLTATVDSDEEGDNVVSPLAPRDSTFGTNNTLPRNTLSNDFGGMDVYVRQFGLKNHDEFFTNEAIVKAFHNYTTQVVTRYANSSSVFSWELANDPRCHSTLKATSSCNPQVVTKWMDQASKHVRSIDTNHLISSGAQGFLCTECTKIMPVPPQSTTGTPSFVAMTEMASATVSDVPSTSPPPSSSLPAPSQSVLAPSSSLPASGSSVPEPSSSVPEPSSSISAPSSNDPPPSSSLPLLTSTLTTTLPPYTETVTLPGTTLTITEIPPDASLTVTETPPTRPLTITLPETTNVVTETPPNTITTLTEGPMTRVLTFTLPTTTTTFTETLPETDITVTETPETFTETITPTTTFTVTREPPTVTETPPASTLFVTPTLTQTTLSTVILTLTDTPENETMVVTLPPNVITSTLPPNTLTITESVPDETVFVTPDPVPVFTTLPADNVTVIETPVDATTLTTIPPLTHLTTLPQSVVSRTIGQSPVTTNITTGALTVIVTSWVLTTTLVSPTSTVTAPGVTSTVWGPTPTTTVLYTSRHTGFPGGPATPTPLAVDELAKRQSGGVWPGAEVVALPVITQTVSITQSTSLVTVTVPRSTTTVTMTLPEVISTVTKTPATRLVTTTLPLLTDTVTDTRPENTLTSTETPAPITATNTAPQITNTITVTLSQTNNTITTLPTISTVILGPTSTTTLTLEQNTSIVAVPPTTHIVSNIVTGLATTTLPVKTISVTETRDEETLIVTLPPDYSTTTLPTKTTTVIGPHTNTTITETLSPITHTTSLPQRTVTRTLSSDDSTVVVTPAPTTVFSTLPPTTVTNRVTMTQPTTRTTTLKFPWPSLVWTTTTYPGPTSFTTVFPPMVTVTETQDVFPRPVPSVGPPGRPLKKRQQEAAAFDGSQGIDSEDIINCPEINFATFQLFPDQNDYGLEIDPTLSAFNNTVNGGVEWIRTHAEMAAASGKPAYLTGFGLVTQTNSPFFVPFNGTIAPYGPGKLAPGGEPYGITEEQLGFAYQRWLDAGIDAGLAGLIHYQWTQRNITGVEGTSIGPVEVEENSASLDVSSENGVTPNDGYAIQETGDVSVQGILEYAAQEVN